MRLIFYILFIVLLTNVSIIGQVSKDHYRVFSANGKPSSLKKIIKKVKKADVVFLGEYHDDSVGHALQFEIFKSVVGKYGEKRKVALSLEMFERDVQVVLDEYLQGVITEKHFLASSRPWGNYKTDYRPLFELAKEKHLPVIAANAPRRYVNMVARLGKDSVSKLSDEAKSWLPPLPIREPSKAYVAKLNALMGGHGSQKILYSQTLWDMSMAYWVSQYLKQDKKNLVVHLNGSFHTSNHLGTVEQLHIYNPKAKALVVTMQYEKDFKNFNKAKHKGLGDFVILTDAKQPRSKR